MHMHAHWQSNHTSHPCSSSSPLGDEGDVEMVPGSELPRLQPESRIFDNRPSALASPVHPAFPEGAWYLQGKSRYWSNNLAE